MRDGERSESPPQTLDARANGDSVGCLTAVLGLLYDGAIVVDAEQRIVFSNDAAARLFGYARSELQGMPLELLVPPRFRPRHTGAESGSGCSAMPDRMLHCKRPIG